MDTNPNLNMIILSCGESALAAKGIDRQSRVVDWKRHCFARCYRHVVLTVLSDKRAQKYCNNHSLQSWKKLVESRCNNQAKKIYLLRPVISMQAH